MEEIENKIKNQKEKVEKLVIEIDKKNRRTELFLIFFGLLIIIIAVFIFLKNITQGFYFVFGIILVFIWQKAWNKYAAQHDKRADELKDELKKEEELCDKA